VLFGIQVNCFLFILNDIYWWSKRRALEIEAVVHVLVEINILLDSVCYILFVSCWSFGLPLGGLVWARAPRQGPWFEHTKYQLKRPRQTHINHVSFDSYIRNANPLSLGLRVWEIYMRLPDSHAADHYPTIPCLEQTNI
jgi:hypothetical protein